MFAFLLDFTDPLRPAKHPITQAIRDVVYGWLCLLDAALGGAVDDLSKE